jgi:hypothetical protein
VSRFGGHKEAQICPFQSPNRSFETTRPVGRASASGGGFGIPNQSPDPLVRRAGRDHPFPLSACAPWREWDVARRVGTGDLPSQGKKTTGLNPTRPGFPPRRSACGLVARTSPQGGTLLRPGPGIIFVAYQIAPAKSPSVAAYNVLMFCAM